VVINFVPIAVMYAVSLALVHGAQRVSAPATFAELGTLIGIVAGAAVAWKLEGRLALFLLALFFAWIGAELIAHLRYGVPLVNGGPLHFTVALASLFGVAAGFVASRSRSSAHA
jgi:hypothetical protein